MKPISKEYRDTDPGPRPTKVSQVTCPLCGAAVVYQGLTNVDCAGPSCSNASKTTQALNPTRGNLTWARWMEQCSGPHKWRYRYTDLPSGTWHDGGTVGPAAAAHSNYVDQMEWEIVK
jgi:hypothetical protein